MLAMKSKIKSPESVHQNPFISVINWLLPGGGDTMDWDNYHRLETIHGWMDGWVLPGGYTGYTVV